MRMGKLSIWAIAYVNVVNPQGEIVYRQGVVTRVASWKSAVCDSCLNEPNDRGWQMKLSGIGYAKKCGGLGFRFGRRFCEIFRLTLGGGSGNTRGDSIVFPILNSSWISVYEV